MKAISLASALILSLVLAACGGGGDGGAPQANAGVSNNGTAAPASGASATSGATDAGKQSGGTDTSGTGGSTQAGTSGATSSGSSDSSGGGSGSSGGSSASGGSTSGSSDSGSGTSGSSGSGSGSNAGGGGASADLGNTVPVVVSNASSVRNFPLVSVTICQPNSGAQAKCATIPNVLLDTGSFGLRLFASVIPSATLGALPIQTDASGKNVASCAAFGSGHTWGSLRTADVKLSSEVAAAVPIQVMTDSAVVSPKPASCEWNTALTSPSVLGANGILGVGNARYDCGSTCAARAFEGFYYADSNPAVPIALPVEKQIANPVALFPVDNNGVIVDIPAVSTRGAPSVTGTLTFGIDTQTNNALTGAGATLFATDGWGNLLGSYSDTSAVTAFIDSGSNSVNFDDNSIIQWNGFFSPPGNWTRDVTLNDTKGASAKVTVNIGNAMLLYASNNYAFSNLGAYMAQTVDLGLPFFFGRRVYYGIDGTSSRGGGTGPYVAYVSR
jgi:hypothetical protein